MLLGVDASGPMLERARQNAPGIRFEQADFATWSAPSARWTCSIRTPRCTGSAITRRCSRACSTQLAQGGWLAVQMPNMHAEPLRRLQLEIAAKGPWAGTLARRRRRARYPAAGANTGTCCGRRVRALDLWETIYLHALSGENAVVQWALGSSLRPFLDLLPREHHDAFLEAYDDALAPHYPRRPDGTTLLPFRRLFLIAQR